ncbi:acetoacetate decarboxylase family protein [Aeromicrobium alkaliterrae]|uniref:Acetoacetate decarboxylase family protein n=1 Tax=Aeromicrobium alkaliterrae TaxID=302168 RepID=A0ABP4VM94_9ACTN
MGVNDETYPAEPWDLHGHAHVGVWLVPAGAAPPPHHAGTRQLRLFGRVVVAAAFFRYDEPSPLTYDEIMATQLVRDGWRPRVSITHIWVDSPASMAGGRALWAIPKDLAAFERVTDRAYTAAGIGTLTLARLKALPFRLPLGFRIAQDRGGSLLTSPVAGSARVGVAKGFWTFDANGPLAFLAGRKPLLTLTVRGFRLLFGRR